jgi:hypothetical protein
MPVKVDARMKQRRVVDPVTAAYIRLIRTSKQAKVIQSQMAPIVLHEMAKGLDPTIKMFGEYIPRFFTNHLGLTCAAEARKLTGASIEHELKTLIYDTHYGSIQNEKDNQTGLYYPDLLGRKMQPENTNREVQAFSVGEDSTFYKKFKRMDKVMNADISSINSHKSLSLISMKPNLIQRAVEGYFSDDIKEKIKPFKSDIIENIKSLTSETSKFRHESVSFDTIPTEDYLIQICRTKHFLMSDTYGIEVHKSIILATVKNGTEKHENIPVCEELIIQLKIQDTSQSRGTPNLVNYNKCCVISCSLAFQSKQDEYNEAYLHCFGENAFSMGCRGALSGLPSDKTKTCSRLAGYLVKQMYNINSTHLESMSTSVSLFKDMFDENMYPVTEKNRNEFTGILNGQNRLLTASATGGVATQQIVENKESFEMKADLIVKHINNQQDLSNRKSGKTAKQVENGLVQKTLNSFLKRQNVRNFMEVENGKCCDIVKWISSPSFSILSLSPRGMPHKKCVFIFTFLDRNILNLRNGYELELKSVQSKMQTMDFSKGDPSGSMLKITSKSSNPMSMLTADLEEELKSLMR